MITNKEIIVEYNKQRPLKAIKEFAYISPIVIFTVLLFVYSDLTILKHPVVVLARIPVLITFAMLFVVRFSKLKSNGKLIDILSILTVISILMMGVWGIILTMHRPDVFRAAISGLIVETFASFFIIRGKRNILIAFTTSFIIGVICIAIFGHPNFMQVREMLNPIAIYGCVVLMALLIEQRRVTEFVLSYNLKEEKEKSEKLYQETSSQNKELIQQKEEILTINNTLGQQTEELQVNLEVISDLNGTLRKKNKAIVDSINYARKIQEAILPSREYINQLFGSCFVLFKPCDIVSGDFYWFKETPRYKIVAAVDCTGHGIPGAFMSMLGYSLLNEITQNKEIESANEILNLLKERLKESLNQSNEIGELADGLDIALCMIDTDNKKLQFSGAYMPLCIIRDNEVMAIKGDKMPIGRYIKEIDSFTNHEVDIRDNDVFYIYSDGYQDQIGGNNKKRFLSGNFKKLLLEIHQKPFEEQKSTLEQTLEDWRSGLGQIDDVLVVGFKVD